MWVVDISNIDSVQQNFTAEIAVILRWKDSRLAHAGNGVVRYPLDELCHSGFNEHLCSSTRLSFILTRASDSKSLATRLFESVAARLATDLCKSGVSEIVYAAR
jgi:hypothetical protein